MRTPARFVFGVIAAALAVGAIGCGPAARGDDGGGGDDTVDVDATPVTFATVTGKVWAPNQAPGQAAPGTEIPIAGALVYVSIAKPEPIPDGVYCEMCVPTPAGGVLTAADGSFTLNVEPNTYWLVIQKGQFRIEQQVALGFGTMALPANQTTLPSQWKPEAGLYMPRVAVAEGTNDNIEDILGKIGFGTMSGNTFGTPTGENGAEMALYSYSGTAAGSVTFLLQNMAEMRKYHIIFFPCSTSMGGLNALLSDQTVLANIRRYVSEGGKLYVTDWSGELADRSFPQQIALGDSGTDSEGTYDPVAFTGTLTTTGDADGGLYESPDGKATDADLAAWLGLQMGPQENGSTGLYNPSAFEVTDNWNWIKKVNPVMLGNDAMGMPVYDTPKVWVSGSKPSEPLAANKPLAVTYEPTGCGKVLYTTFQTASSGHVGLYPQERILIYLIMEIQTCSDNPIF
ncbi:MAG: hypothetical protein H0X17_21505 [Deltaproteobacteria bacterium]|nr:hypothetical protein [Deltaproteobacteria bacterium]